MSTYLYYNSGSNVSLGGDLTLSQVKDALSVATDIENDMEDLQNKIKTLKSKLLEGRSDSGDKDLDLSASEEKDEFVHRTKKINSTIRKKKKGGAFGSHPVECTCDNCVKLAEEILGGIVTNKLRYSDDEVASYQDSDEVEGGDSDDEELVVVGPVISEGGSDHVYDPFA